MPQAMQACVISKTPQASPPQKMARKALEEGAEAAADAEAEVIRNLLSNRESVQKGGPNIDGLTVESSHALVFRSRRSRRSSGPPVRAAFARLGWDHGDILTRSPSATVPHAA